MDVHTSHAPILRVAGIGGQRQVAQAGVRQQLRRRQPLQGDGFGQQTGQQVRPALQGNHLRRMYEK